MASITPDPSSGPPATTPRHAVAASFSGAVLEWYDFYIFGTASALVFPDLFFPESSDLAGTLASFGTFAAGFITRPLGAILFGHFGDRLGRRTMLILTISIMGACTFLIGLLPTFHQVGVWAPAVLVTLRMLQGLGIGGEFGGGALVALENSPRGRRGLMGSLHQAGTSVGLLLATGVFALVELFPQGAFESAGWRIPFLLSGLFLAVAFYVRRSLPETSTFRAERSRARRIPLFALIREHPRNILLAIGARMADAVTFNVINVFGIAYATKHFGLPNSMMLTGFTIAAAVEVVLVPFIGILSDRVGRRPVYLTGIAVCGLGGFAYFPLLSIGSTVAAWLAIVGMLAVGTGFMFAIQGTLFSELFGTRVRYTGLGLAYQVSALIGAAPTPIIATSLSSAAGNSYWPVAIYLAAICALSFACVLYAGETSRTTLVTEPDSDPGGPAAVKETSSP